MQSRTFSISLPPVVWNGLGVGASGLCIAHCLLTPVVLLLVPIAGLAVLEEERVHLMMLLVVVLVGAIAFSAGYARHGRVSLLALPAAGLVLLGLAAFGGEALGELGESLLTLAGGTIMIGSHWLNQTFCRACPRCCDEPGCGVAESAEQVGRSMFARLR